ncbi:MAG: DUF4333 domain-containing protein [Actinomycetota bacterium]|nr:DUF4333 domain-containing protein [Actinomycetota bacterium]
MTLSRALLAAAASVTLALAGCGQEVIDEQDLEDEVTRVVREQAQQDPKDVDCPGDLDAKAGEKMTCTLTTNEGTKRDANVTVDSAEGEDARFTVDLGAPQG